MFLETVSLQNCWSVSELEEIKVRHTRWLSCCLFKIFVLSFFFSNDRLLSTLPRLLIQIKKPFKLKIFDLIQNEIDYLIEIGLKQANKEEDESLSHHETDKSRKWTQTLVVFIQNVDLQICWMWKKLIRVGIYSSLPTCGSSFFVLITMCVCVIWLLGSTESTVLSSWFL